MLKIYIEKLLKGHSLTQEESRSAIQAILNGANACQVSAFLILLRAKQETTEEILGIVQAMQEKMIPLPVHEPVLDIVGTGGDGANTINISTGSAILAASCGVKIAKHGNRSVSSLCGSADVLEALGINIYLPPEKIVQSIKKFGFGFCFAPNFHPAMKTVKDIRKNLNVPTCFNILGPLLNPAKPRYLMVGVFKEKLMPLMAEVISNLPIKKTLIFHSEGLDELTTARPAKVLEITSTGTQSYILNSSNFGFPPCSLNDLHGGTTQENAAILMEIFKGKKGFIADTLIFNASVALYVYGITPSIEEAIPMVKNSIKNGKVIQLLNNVIAFSQGEKTHE